MNGALAHFAVWLNAVANPAGKLFLAPIAHVPGWLSITAVSAVLGIACLIAFKYTSSQRAIRRVRDDIAAHLLAVKLFPDDLLVTLRCQGRVLWGALRLLALALAPMLVLCVPVSLLLAQMSLWYDARPLKVGEEAVVTVKMNHDVDSCHPNLRIEPAAAAEVVVGPVRISNKREVCWSIRAGKPAVTAWHSSPAERWPRKIWSLAMDLCAPARSGRDGIGRTFFGNPRSRLSRPIRRSPPSQSTILRAARGSAEPTAG